MGHIRTARTILGIIGNILSCGMFMSPVPAFRQIIKWRDTRGFSAVPYAVTTLNCLLWILYGMPFVKPNSVLVVSVNSFGLVVEMIYLTIFFAFCHDDNRKLKIAGLLLLNVTLFILLAGLMLSLPHAGERSDTVGTICVIFNTVMYASPLAIMFFHGMFFMPILKPLSRRKVIKEKSVKYMPFWLSFVITINAAVWTAYSCLPPDRNLMVPNCLGTFLGICQLILYGSYFTSTNWDDNPDQENQTERDVKGSLRKF